jgi:hypothetical protein
VVVLNGGHCSRESRLSHERLTQCRFSVLTPSRPGYDGTPAGVGKTAQEAADALSALLETLQILSADVIGISPQVRLLLSLLSDTLVRFASLSWSLR